MSKQSIVLPTGKTVELDIGDYVYIDLGDALKGVEISGAVRAIDEHCLTVSDQKISIFKISNLDVD